MELRESSKTELRNIYVEHPEILTDRSRLESLLRDHGQNPPEMALLVRTFDEAIPRRLLNPNPGVPVEVNISRLSALLQQNLFMDRSAAVWAVNAWATALGVLPPSVPSTAAVQTGAPLKTVVQTMDQVDQADQADQAVEKLANIPFEVKFDTDGKAVFVVPGNEPSKYKVKFHGDRLGKLLFGAFVAFRIVIASTPLRASLTDLYQDYTVAVWIGISGILLLTSFTIKRRFKPFF